MGPSIGALCLGQGYYRCPQWILNAAFRLVENTEIKMRQDHTSHSYGLINVEHF